MFLISLKIFFFMQTALKDFKDKESSMEIDAE